MWPLPTYGNQNAAGDILFFKILKIITTQVGLRKLGNRDEHKKEINVFPHKLDNVST